MKSVGEQNVDKTQGLKKAFLSLILLTVCCCCASCAKQVLVNWRLFPDCLVL